MSYIDRNALGIGYADRNLFKDPAYADGWNAAIEILETTPDADVEPIRHGEWIYKEYKPTKGDAIGFYECSECGHASWIKEYNYCPNCGAKMDKGET